MDLVYDTMLLNHLLDCLSSLTPQLLNKIAFNEMRGSSSARTGTGYCIELLQSVRIEMSLTSEDSAQ
ncbi:hypothetical protein CDAR_481081 [Caerostris darwini]|uniref:Uncharacterized protein n=1 Tax=Caerostris darwini TaxID=1538125 RepID=A0AAV4W422_9ARAC|nr:hypothetical protein CDAR_481081 [Caerostris darwini]